jgi:signal transduction histidine kinase
MIRRRLTAVAVLVLAGALAAVTVGFYALLSYAIERDAEAVLQTRVEAALSVIRVVYGRVSVAEGTADETLDATTWVLGPQGAVVLAPLHSAVPTTEVVALAGVTTATARDLGAHARVLATPVPGHAPGDATVVVSLSLAPYETTERLGLIAAVVLDVVTLSLLALVSRWLVGASLGPVDEMTRAARDWADHDLDRRFGEGTSATDEVGRLGATLNELLTRLGASLRHERRLTDEIAHEVRTPLARARIEAELAAARSQDQDTTDALAAIISDIDEVSATVATLLDTARGRLPSIQVCEVDDVLADCASTARPRDSVQVDAVTGQMPVVVALDAAVLRRILSPQLENALRHARTRVRLSVAIQDRTAVIEITDDGPGVGDDHIERVFLPGQRGEADDRGGLGLGLALARRLARDFGGDVVAVAGDGGRFLTRLPLIAGTVRPRSTPEQSLRGPGDR